MGNAPRTMAWVVADASAAGAPAIISEANSVSCGGKAGVSDSPAAAVWAVRFVISALKTGFREVRFHFSGDPYDPFVLSGATVVPRPLEGAMAELNQLLPVGTSVRTVAVPGAKAVLASSFAGPTGALALLLDNEQRAAQPLAPEGRPQGHGSGADPHADGTDRVHPRRNPRRREADAPGELGRRC